MAKRRSGLFRRPDRVCRAQLSWGRPPYRRLWTCAHLPRTHRSGCAGRPRFHGTDPGQRQPARNGPDVVGRISGARPEGNHTEKKENLKYRYAFTQLIRNGITTALPITSMYYRQWAEHYQEFANVAEIAIELGIRA